MKWLLALLALLVCGCRGRPNVTVEEFIAQSKGLGTLAELEAKWGKPADAEHVELAPNSPPNMDYERHAWYVCSNGQVTVVINRKDEVVRLVRPEDL